MRGRTRAVIWGTRVAALSSLGTVSLGAAAAEGKAGTASQSAETQTSTTQASAREPTARQATGGEGLAEAAPESPPSTKVDAEEEAEADGDDFGATDLLTFYERNYIITGFSEASQAKFQLSIKYNIWPNKSAHSVYFGYTQLSFWDIYDYSTPFAEINFNPVAVYEYRLKRPEPSAYWYCGTTLFRAALEHSSNGKSGLESRAFNRIVGTTTFGCYGSQQEHLEVRFDVWPPLLFAAENPDLTDFIGYTELTVQWLSEQRGTWYGQVELATKLRKGASAGAGVGALYLDASWRPNYGELSQLFRFTPYLFMQFFTGYAESLSTYNVPQTHFRVGLGLVDGSSQAK